MKNLRKMLAGLLTLSILPMSGMFVKAQTINSFSTVYDFNDKTASSGYWTSSFPTITSGSSLIYRSGQTGYAFMKKDDEHGMSYVLSGTTGLGGAFNVTDAANQTCDYFDGTAHFSFDFYLDQSEITETWFYVQLNNLSSYNDSKQMLTHNGKWSSGANANYVYAYGAQDKKVALDNKWHRVDIAFDSNTTTNQTAYDVFIDGKWKRTAKISEAAKYIAILTPEAGTKQRLYIDNISFSSPRAGAPLTAVPINSKLSLTDEKTSIRFSGTLDATNPTPAVTVTETDRNTGATRNISGATAEIDYTSTKLDVYYNEPLRSACDYSITLPSDLKSIHNETVATASVTVSTPETLEYYEDFESYNNGDSIARLYKTLNKSAKAVFTKTDSPYGNAAIFSASSYTDTVAGFILPEKILQTSTTDVIISFDMQANKKWTNMNVSGCDGIGFDTSGKGTVFMLNPDGRCGIDWNNFATNMTGWNHYDVILDLDKSVGSTQARYYLYRNGERLTTKSFYPTDLSWLSFVSQDGGSYSLDNLHIRLRDKNAVSTDILGESVPQNTTEINVKFEDAVKDLTAANFEIENDVEFSTVEGISVKNVTPYGATVVIPEDALKVRDSYTLNLVNVSSTAEETLDKSSFSFTCTEPPAPYTEITNAVIKNGGSELANAAAWDKDTAYTITLTANSNETKTVYAIVAGYGTDKCLTNVQIKPVDIRNSGDFTVTLDAMDMNGANIIKCYAFNSMSDLIPIMMPPKSY